MFFGGSCASPHSLFEAALVQPALEPPQQKENAGRASSSSAQAQCALAHSHLRSLTLAPSAHPRTRTTNRSSEHPVRTRARAPPIARASTHCALAHAHQQSLKRAPSAHSRTRTSNRSHEHPVRTRARAPAIARTSTPCALAHAHQQSLARAPRAHSRTRARYRLRKPLSRARSRNASGIGPHSAMPYAPAKYENVHTMGRGGRGYPAAHGIIRCRGKNEKKNIIYLFFLFLPRQRIIPWAAGYPRPPRPPAWMFLASPAAQSAS